ncbi:MAG TPA: hypothetical protein VF463_17515 [Sphingobium sp.]
MNGKQLVTHGVVPVLTMALMTGLAGAAQARDSLGVFESWGAFRDAETPRCFAIAQPAGASVMPRGDAGDTSVTGRWRPFAAIGYWPRANVRGQVHIRLSREIAMRSPLTLSIGERQFTLTGGGADAWAPNRQVDAAIVAAMRSATSMSLSARARTGAGFADTYRLRGAATAIDAAALGCGRLR